MTTRKRLKKPKFVMPSSFFQSAAKFAAAGRSTAVFLSAPMRQR
jgi:hypothetical protein